MIGNKNHRKFVLLILLLLCAVVAFLVWFFLPKPPVVTGRIIAFPERDLSKMKVSFGLFKSGKEVADYSSRLKKDGTFKFKVNERGEYFLEHSGFSYILHAYEDLQFSHDMVTFFYNFQNDQIIDLGEMYLTEAITISSPESEAVYNEPNDIIFKWSGIPFAHFYTLIILRVDDEEKLVINTHCLESSIDYRTICSLPLGKKLNGDMASMIAQTPFNMPFDNLSQGKYRIRVDAYRKISGKELLIVVGQSSRAIPIYFYLE